MAYFQLINPPSPFKFLSLGNEHGESGNMILSSEARRNIFNLDLSRNIDRVSVELLKMTNSKLLESVLPLKTVGDGNCLFRAFFMEQLLSTVAIKVAKRIF